MLKLNLAPEPRILKQFAFFAVVGLPLIAWVVLRICVAFGAFDPAGASLFAHPAVWWTAGVGLAQLALFLAGIRAPTRWIFVVLMVIALPIGFVLSQVLMAAIFYLLFTPIGLFFRLTGRDAMGRKFDRQKASYWHDRGPARSPASYFKLY